MRITPAKLARYLRHKAVEASRAALAGYARPTGRDDLIRIGSAYGGWWVPAGMLDRSSVCYLAGVGEDVTFDLGLVDRFGCDVWAFDPTPRAIAHAEAVQDRRFHFLPVGLWSEDTSLFFYQPVEVSHVSHSVTNLQRTSGGFEAECKTVTALMSELGHDRVDLLKLDIEGAEVAVIDSLLGTGVLPAVLCVEFDAIEPPWTSIRRVRRLKAAGYAVCWREDRNYTFVRELG